MNKIIFVLLSGLNELMSKPTLNDEELASNEISNDLITDFLQINIRTSASTTTVPISNKTRKR